MTDTKRRIKNEEIKKETTEPEGVSQSTAMLERMESVSRKILITARNELYMKMRFLDVALSCMPFIPDTGADGMGTDGLYLYYDPQYLGGLFREDRVMVNRIYLHLVLHGIFRHMLRRKGREERIYHLACDIVAESIIDGLQYRCVMKARSLPRREMYRMLKKEMKTLTAERVFEVLKKEEFPETKSQTSVWTITATGRKMRIRRSRARSRISGRTSANVWRRRWRHFPKRHRKVRAV